MFQDIHAETKQVINTELKSDCFQSHIHFACYTSHNNLRGIRTRSLANQSWKINMSTLFSGAAYQGEMNFL
jgi:hypothetical protein